MEDFTSSKPILSVSQINQKIRNSLESTFPSLWIKGELSNFIAHSSGHWYFSLKDQNSQIKGLMFRGQNQRLSFQPKNGDEILVQGNLSVYHPRGDYQISCKEMEIVGSGSLQKEFEQIKIKLKTEGLFDASRKKPLPLFPNHIAIITSPTGAAIRDILQILKRRFKAVKVTLIPSTVQGDGATPELLKALTLSKKLKADVLIIGRGGGSIEDLWAFNSETLARAIADYPTPVISAVGHEIDFTICDFVADLRAPTPSAAAELVVQNRDEILNKIKNFQKQLSQNFTFQLKFLREKLQTLKKTLIRPDRLIQDFSQKLDEMNTRLDQSLKYNLERQNNKLNNLKQILESLNPKKIMERGFSIVTTKNGDFISQTSQIEIEDSIDIEFFKGKAKATIKQKE